MTLKFQIIIIGIIIISLIVIIYGQYKGKIEYRFALGWSALSVVILVFSIWPKLLEKISKLLGIYDPVNMLMFFAILLLLFAVFSLSMEVSKQSDQIKKLTQEIAILKKEAGDKPETDEKG